MRQYEQNVVAQGSSHPRDGPTNQQGGADAVPKSRIWALWNEGNLFSLSVPELGAFLQSTGATVDPKAKKSQLVRLVEDMMAQEQPSLVKPDEESAAADEYSSQGGDLFEEADVYGDWGAEPGFEERREQDFMEVTAHGLAAEVSDPLAPRAFQLLHNEATADVALVPLNVSKLPGCANMKNAMTTIGMRPQEANRLRFRKSFGWCVKNLWNLNMDGELNIGAGKALYWRSVAKHNKDVLPLWTCQQHLHNLHPYSWFAVAHETNVPAIETFCAKKGLQVSQQPEKSYRLVVKRLRDQLDIELNSNLQCISVNRPWDRFLASHVLRTNMPDLRYLVRARHIIKKKLADPYFEAEILRNTKDSVQSVLPPELGDVVYTAERIIRRWSTTLMSGAQIQMVETKRTPLIVTRPGEESERLEYELIVNIPQQSERVDVSALADELWKIGSEFAVCLEDGMQELQAYTMPASAAFEPVVSQ